MLTLRDYWRILQMTCTPVLGCALVVFLLLGVTYWIATGRKGLGNVIFVLVFALLGSIIGLIMGNTREASVSAILPALLTIITALAGYAFTKESIAVLRPVIPYCLVAVMLSSYYSLNVGATVRQKSDHYKEDYELWKLWYEKVDLEVHKAEEFKKRGLPFNKD